MKRLFSFACLFLFSMQAESTFDSVRYYAFIRKLDKFNREYEGCQPNGYPPMLVCVEGAGTFNMKLWHELQEESKGIFGTQ